MTDILIPITIKKQQTRDLASIFADKAIIGTENVVSYDQLQVFHFAPVIIDHFKNQHIQGVIFGNFGAMNYGDEAILAGQLEELKTIKGCAVSVISRFPRMVKKVHHVSALSLVNVFAVVKKIFQSDFIVIGGGGLFCRNDTGILGFLFQVYSLCIMALPLLLKKRVYVLGIGIYDNMNPLFAWITEKLLKKTDIVTVRDSHSYALLKKKQVTASLYKDNSFLINLLSKVQIAENPYFLKKINTKKIQIGIALKNPESKKQTKKLINIITKFMYEQSKVADFWLYPMDSHGEYYNDEKLARDIASIVSKRVTVHVIPTHWQPVKLFSSFRLMDYFISMRLHSSIFCYRTQTPFYGISYEKKCASFLESINHTYTTIETITYKSLASSFLKIKTLGKL